MSVLHPSPVHEREEVRVLLRTIPHLVVDDSLLPDDPGLSGSAGWGGDLAVPPAHPVQRAGEDMAAAGTKGFMRELKTPIGS